MADHDHAAEPADDNPLKPDDFNQRQADQHQRQALLDLEVARDVRYNPRYDWFFEGYKDGYRAVFARNYANRRQRWTQHGEQSEWYLTVQLTQFEHEAWKRLFDIQQKKLFDLQCQWRAELVELPGVRVSSDFEKLGETIEQCTLVPPITPDELALYLDWVAGVDYGEHLYERHGDFGHRYGWQGYRAVKAALDADEDDEEPALVSYETSEWYEYHNLRTGHDRLLRLPNLRGQKEERYLNAWRAANAARVAALPPSPPLDPRPWPIYTEDVRAVEAEFARQFETSELRRWREAYETAEFDLTVEEEALRSHLDFLQALRVPVPIEAHDDWREAIAQAVYALRRELLLENLPRVYEDYRQRLAAGVAQPRYTEPSRIAVRDWYAEAVLEGRELLGEPRDFDF